jgi:acetyl/propionyl-CoA carboxylase alpha subunit
MQGFIDIAGQAYPLRLEPIADGGVRLPDGAAITLTEQADSLTLQIGETHHAVEIVRAGRQLWIRLNCRTYEVTWRGAVEHFAAQADGVVDGAVRAPMPGLVVAVMRAAGEAVQAGEAVMVIESMKLETTLKAPRAGVLATLNVAEGESFERGAVLFEIGVGE